MSAKEVVSPITPNNKSDEEFIDVSSEDEEETSLSAIVNKLVENMKECPKEKLEELKKVNDELISNCQEKVIDGL